MSNGEITSTSNAFQQTMQAQKAQLAQKGPRATPAQMAKQAALDILALQTQPIQRPQHVQQGQRIGSNINVTA